MLPSDSLPVSDSPSSALFYKGLRSVVKLTPSLSPPSAPELGSTADGVQCILTAHPSPRSLQDGNMLLACTWVLTDGNSLGSWTLQFSPHFRLDT